MRGRVDQTTARETRIFSLLQQAAHCIKKEADRSLLKAVELTTAQAGVLTIVGGEGSVSQKEIAHQLKLSESAMTAMIRRLRDRNFITQKSDPDDARTRQIRLTASGKKAISKGRNSFSQVNATLEETLGAKHIESLAEDLKSIITAFSNG